MGRIVLANASEVRPTQDFLRQGTINFYLKLLRRNRDIAPVPVMEGICYDQEYDTIDGHHRLAVAHSRSLEITLWVADSPKDIIPYDAFPEVQRDVIDCCNMEIKRRFDMVYSFVPCDCQGEKIENIDQLIKYSGVKI